MKRDRTYLLWTGILVLIGVAGTTPAYAGKSKPEYTELAPYVGKTLEVEGKLGGDGLFVASDIEELAESRKPKLRAKLERVDAAGRSVNILGRSVHVTEKTEFDSGTFSDLARGRFVEVKCRVDNDGNWKATSIQTLNVKPSNKIKVTITGASADGIAPDTLSASGFLIILDESTDINNSANAAEVRDLEMFGKLSFDQPGGTDSGLRTSDGRMFLTGEYRQTLRSRNEYDLTEQFQSDRGDTEPQVRLRWVGYLNDQLRATATLRARKNYVLSSDLGEATGDVDAHFLELLVLARDIGGAPFAVQVGRQRFRESREWLFDDYLDAARVFFYGAPWLDVEAAVIHAVSPIKTKFETWTDYLAIARFRTEPGTFSAYILARKDTDTIRNREPRWVGFRYSGRPVTVINAWGEASFMRGEDKQRTLNAWAMDVGATARLRSVRFQPSATVGYAVGSGNDANVPAGEDHRFRQTAYEDNSANVSGVTSASYYGSVLDPELSNIVILTLAAGIRPMRGASFEMLYHQYRQHQPDDATRGNLVDPPARPSGANDDLGWGVDAVIGFPKVADHLRVNWTLGWFSPGQAFAPRVDRAFQSKLEIRLSV